MRILVSLIIVLLIISNLFMYQDIMRGYNIMQSCIDKLQEARGKLSIEVSHDPEEQALIGGHVLYNLPPDDLIWKKELTPQQVKAMEKASKDRWIFCPICECYFHRGEYFTNHKQNHVRKNESGKTITMHRMRVVGQEGN